MRILLIDDDKPVLELLEIILKMYNHEVDCASDALSAIPMIEQNNYDFAFVDYKMPEHDGAWFMQNAKVPNTTKVLLLTAFIDREVINSMFKLGICGYLIKPIAENEIIEHLEFHSHKS